MKAWFLIVSMLTLTIMQGLFIASVFAMALDRLPQSYTMAASIGSGIFGYAFVVVITFYMGRSAGQNGT